LKKAFMFKALNREEMDIVIGAMAERCFKNGEVVIMQGEAGAVLYVVEEGQLACHKLFDGDSEPKYLKTFEPGDAFGELALLYNAPRAATITAKSDVVLWELDRDTFNHIVKDVAQRKREKYDNFLSSVKIFHSVDNYERAKMADTIKEQDFNKG
jgi:cAMP-dependent protein kinase regulator